MKTIFSIPIFIFISSVLRLKLIVYVLSGSEPKENNISFLLFFRHRFDRRKQGLTINRKKVSRKRALSPKRTLSTEPSLAESPPCLDPILVIDTFMTSSGPSCPPQKKKMTPLSNQCTLRSASLKEKRKMAKRRNLKKESSFSKGEKSSKYGKGND